MRKVNDLPGTFTNPDTYLTNYSFNLLQDDQTFIVGAASSRIPVTQEAGKFNVYPPGYFWRDEAKVRPLGGRPVQVGYGVTDGNYYAEEWALEHTIDDRSVATRAPDQPRRERHPPADHQADDPRRAHLGDQLLQGRRLGMEVTGVAAARARPVPLVERRRVEPDQRYRGLEGAHPAATGMSRTCSCSASTSASAEEPPGLHRAGQVHVERGDHEQRHGGAVRGRSPARRSRDLQRRRGAHAERRRRRQDFQYIVDPNAAWLGYIDPNPTLDSPTAIANFAWDALVPGQTNDFGGVISRGRDGRAYSDYFHSVRRSGCRRSRTTIRSSRSTGPGTSTSRPAIRRRRRPRPQATAA
jgi:hypothetical protein